MSDLELTRGFDEEAATFDGGAGNTSTIADKAIEGSKAHNSNKANS
jgi:hypothetical protein